MTIFIKLSCIVTLGAWCIYEIINQLKWFNEWDNGKTLNDKVLSFNIAALWLILWIAASITIIGAIR